MFPSQTIVGKEFNNNKIRYVKLLQKNMVHNEYQFKIGLNEDKNFNENNVCGADGLYFCKYEDITQWLSYNGKYMYWLCDVKIPDDALLVIYDNKIKTSKMWIINMIPLETDELLLTALKKDFSLIKMIGFNIENNIEQILITELKCNFNIVKFLKTNHITNQIELIIIRIIKEDIKKIRLLKIYNMTNMIKSVLKEMIYNDESILHLLNDDISGYIQFELIIDQQYDEKKLKFISSDIIKKVIGDIISLSITLSLNEIIRVYKIYNEMILNKLCDDYDLFIPALKDCINYLK
jgi:hypothetical protein